MSQQDFYECRVLSFSALLRSPDSYFDKRQGEGAGGTKGTRLTRKWRESSLAPFKSWLKPHPQVA
ncbi:hypothetical protein [aff. Roholtiella sp. LEGE 12411]|uniref:hypothetical protein n=1 Tax=aff. Roholtiella sp. LEGE 12411 TaxID=1828822 RepID=UPI00187FEDE6|nr:hypothetical protein [aff. Roholtiella sp. LEGE 12411]